MWKELMDFKPDENLDYLNNYKLSLEYLKKSVHELPENEDVVEDYSALYRVGKTLQHIYNYLDVIKSCLQENSEQIFMEWVEDLTAAGMKYDYETGHIELTSISDMCDKRTFGFCFAKPPYFKNEITISSERLIFPMLAKDHTELEKYILDMLNDMKLGKVFRCSVRADFEEGKTKKHSYAMVEITFGKQ